MESKAERAMTERQRYWLGHVRAADAAEDLPVRELTLRDLTMLGWGHRTTQLKPAHQYLPWAHPQLSHDNIVDRS